MHKRITFRNMTHSAPMEEHANDQLRKIEEFLETDKSPRYIDLMFEPSKVHAHHRVELRVKTPSYDRVSHYEGPDFYAVLDRVIDTMYRELHEDKRRILDDRKHGDDNSAKKQW